MGDALITLERIGPSHCWVARISGRDGRYDLEREFLSGVRDYTRANPARTRGVRTTYTLRDGEVYEICAPRSWTRADRYYVRVRGGVPARIPAEEVAEIFPCPGPAKV